MNVTFIKISGYTERCAAIFEEVTADLPGRVKATDVQPGDWIVLPSEAGWSMGQEVFATYDDRVFLK